MVSPNLENLVGVLGLGGGTASIAASCNALARWFPPARSLSIITCVGWGSSSTPGATDFSPGSATRRPGIISRFAASTSRSATVSNLHPLVIILWAGFNYALLAHNRRDGQPDNIGGSVNQAEHQVLDGGLGNELGSGRGRCHWF